MTSEIPQYGLKAYALFFAKHGSAEEFGQHDLDWIVGQSMKKKIFSLLLRAGWIKKESRNTYRCAKPEEAVRGLLEFRVPEILKKAQRPYAFTGLSAIELWSDYSYIQRGIEKSPYFIGVLERDLNYWKAFFGGYNVPFYIREGTTIGEYVIFEPADSLIAVKKEGFSVISLAETEKLAKSNEIYSYAYNYIRQKYGSVATQRK
ncbi:MAG: hypothetical protein ACREBH_00355 [Candidatus Micrarchaeaceae archaeon]